MLELKTISSQRLTWSKIQGCYCESGLKETIRRIVGEIARSARPPINRLDISIVTERLAIGASPRSDEAIIQLLILGFKQIIDLRAERKQSDILVSRRDILFSWVPTYDNWKPKTDEFFRELVKEVNHFLSLAGNGKLFLCCGAGEHRAPLAAVLALVMMGYPFDSATAMIQKARPVAELLPVYLVSLRRFLESTDQVSLNSPTNQTNSTN